MGGKKKLMGASWAHRPWFFFWENGRFKKKKNMGGKWALHPNFIEMPSTSNWTWPISRKSNKFNRNLAHNFFFEKMGVPKKKKMGASWAPCPWFFFGENGLSKKKKIMGSAHFLAVRFLGAHDPYIPIEERPFSKLDFTLFAVVVGGWAGRGIKSVLYCFSF